MSFDTLAAAQARRALQLTGGVSASFQPHGEPVRPDPVIVLVDREVQEVMEVGVATVNSVVLSVLVAEVGDIRKGDRFATATDTWMVERVLRNDGHMIDAEVR